MKKLVLLVGPPGSGKSTRSKEMNHVLDGTPYYFRVSQDDQGRENHLTLFKNAIDLGENIIVDRMNFNKEQRNRYIKPAIEAGYTIEIVVFHVPRQTCFDRMMARENHPTINGITETIKTTHVSTVKCENEKARQANSALDTFFTKYERVEDTEADKVTRLGWDGPKTDAIICDLDGTLCDINHRLHHVKHEVKKHNRWDLFNKEIPNDKLNDWCWQILCQFYNNPMDDYPTGTDIVLCSGRVDSSRNDTVEWLRKHYVLYHNLFMRHRQDFRQDYIIKEIILDFEILPRYKVLFAIDDRQQVVDMWRRRGIVCLQCAPGDF